MGAMNNLSPTQIPVFNCERFCNSYGWTTTLLCYSNPMMILWLLVICHVVMTTDVEGNSREEMNSCHRNSSLIIRIDDEPNELSFIPTGGKANITCVQECKTIIEEVTAECVEGVWEYNQLCKRTPNCSILLIGGSLTLSSLEWFNPWAPMENRLLATRLLTPRFGHISAVLDDGRVLIAGGYDGREYFSSVELLDLQQGSLSQGPSMANKRRSAAAAAIDGLIFVCGGYDGGVLLGSCERFHAGIWAPMASMKTKRWGLALVALDGVLYAIGGFNGSRLSVVEAYDIQRDVWTTKSPMPTARAAFGAAAWGQSIIACGGCHCNSFDLCEKYDVGADRWTAISPMNKPRFGFTLTAVGDWLVAVGKYTEGNDGNENYFSAEIYSPNKDQWTLLTTNLTQKRSFHTAVVI